MRVFSLLETAFSICLGILGSMSIGISLGLLGSGGSILTLPVLLFLLHRPDKLAIAESLAIVGIIACVGAIPYLRNGQVDVKNLFFFGVASMCGSFFGACCSQYVSGQFQVVVFAWCMLAAAAAMLMKSCDFSLKLEVSPSYKWVGFGALLAGSLTGFVGVGGGFLITPILVILGGLSMSMAIGTSLVIIALNAFIGFAEHAQHMAISWETVGFVSLLGIAGACLGSYFSSKIDQKNLQKLFACFTFVVALAMPLIHR